MTSNSKEITSVEELEWLQDQHDYAELEGI